MGKKTPLLPHNIVTYMYFWQCSPVVVLEEGVFRDASSNDRVKFLLAEWLLWGGVVVVVTLDPDAALVDGALDGDGWGGCALWEAAVVGGVGTLGSLACSRWTVMFTVAPAGSVW